MGYERLSRITESSGDGTKSYNPTVFTYGTTNEAISYGAITTNINVNNISSINSDAVTGDFNGDGKMDFLVYPTTGTTSKSKYWLFYNLDPLVNPNISYEQNIGAFEEIFASSLLTGDATAGYKLMAKQGWTVIKNNAATNTVTFSNYSAEGGMSPVFLQYEKSNQFPLFSWGYPAICGDYSSYVTKTYNVPKKFISGDFNGDGLTDLIAIDKEIYYQSACDRNSLRSGGQSYFVNLDKRLTTNYVTNAGIIIPSTADKYRIADFNGDGKSDLYVFNYQSVRVYGLNDLNQFVLLYQNATADVDILFERLVLMGDYNGDGKSDFIIPKGYGSNYAKYISTGTSFIRTDVSYNIPYIANSGSDCLISNTIIPTDINGDGKTDLITYSTTGCNSNNTGQYWIRVWNNMDSNFVNTATYNTGSITGVKQYALPIFLSSDRPNFSLELAAISDNKIYRFNSQKDFNKERLLKTITTGNGVKESITYSPIVNDLCTFNCNPLYRSSGPIENYPNMDIPVAPSFQVVSKLEKIRNNVVYKEQLFGYYGAVSNLEGLGFLGFRATMRTNWHDNTTTIISNISKFDVSLRGANTENYSVLYLFSPSSSFAPTDFISKSILTYNTAVDALQANKVFKLKNTVAKQYNGLENTNSETTTVYDAYNNPTKATTLLKEGSTLVQTSVGDVTYIPLTASPYVVGRPSGKIQTITLAATGEITSNEEQYSYAASLLTQVKKRGNDAGVYITEDNIYDTFGNITKKTITVPAVAPNPAPAPRVTNYQYDSLGRFLTKSTDIEGLSTTFAYNTNNGLLVSETNPYSLTTSYLYDSWFKKTKTTDYLGKSNNYAYSRINSVNTLVTTTGDDGSYGEEVFDDLGRKITSGVKDISGNTSKVSYLYDIYDRNIKVSEPYIGSGASQWSETKYDVYGRIMENKSFTGKIVSVSYSGLTTTVNDGSKTKTSVKNALGNVITMTDTPGGTINYTYFANGNLKATNYAGVITTIEQDGWGRKTKLTDPSAGTYTYVYNGFGETTSETTPNGTTTYTLNAVGKLTAKTISGTNTNSSTVYNYNGTTKLLDSSIFTNTLEAGAVTTNTYIYDSYKRLVGTNEQTPYATFSKTINSLDAFGRVDTETTSGTANGKTSSKTLKKTYKNSYPWQILDNASQQVLWQTNTVNARGQLLTAGLGNGIAITNSYDMYGFATQFKNDKTSTSVNIMTLGTTFDPQKGNLTSRTNSLFGTTNNFTYDSLDRLTSYPDAQGNTVTQSYKEDGRIETNTLGTYNYTNTAKKYQNTSVTVTPEALTYYQAKPLQTITYNAFKSPVEITEQGGVDRISFTYNDNNSRSTMFYGNTNTEKTLRPNRKYYSADGSMEIKQNIVTGATEFVTYIGGDAYVAPIVLKSDGTTQNYLYLHRDYQGSILAITNEAGTVVEKRLFDAWGAIASIQDGAGNTLNVLTILDRGYTGHEHLQSVGLINMNGRIYDPKLHRFLQPDNYVQEPFNTQNYNRYGYCWNNPLKFTDPSGEWIWIVAAAVIGGVVNWAVHGAQFNMEGLKAFGIGAAAGTIGALTGGAAFAAAGGAAGGIGGALAGAAGGAVGAAYSQVVLSVGNHIAFGDPLMSGKEFITGIAFGAVLGGATNGIAALRNGRTFWKGTLPNPQVSPISLPSVGIKQGQAPEIKTDAKLPSTTQTSTAPTTEANTTGKVTFTKNIDGNGYKVDGLGIVDDGAIKLDEVVVHGNSLSSQKPTWGYKLFSNDGTFLKNGITNKLIPEARYTKAFMSDKYMEAIPFPNRLGAYQWEFVQNQILRGPLNLNMH